MRARTRKKREEESERESKREKKRIIHLFIVMLRYNSNTR